MANSVVEFFADKENSEEVDKLISKGIEFTEDEVTEGIFTGYNVVITGTLQNYKRQEAQQIVRSLGGTVSDTVSKAVNLVVYGENAGSKLDKAKKNGIEIIDEDEFIRRIKK